jgi:ATP-dependent DNA helicase RecG
MKKLEHRQVLEEPVTLLKGIGPVTAQELARLGIRTIGDLLFYFPYRYEDFRLRHLSEVNHEQTVSLKGKVMSPPVLQRYGGKRSRVSFKVMVDQHVITAVIFNRPYVQNQIRVGIPILMAGKMDKQRWQLTVYFYKLGEERGDPEQQSLIPVYSTSGTLKVAQIRKWVQEALQYAKYVPELLPESLIKQYKLMPRHEALLKMHFPRNAWEGKQARRRFVYEELLIFQLKMQSLKMRHRQQMLGISQRYDEEKLKQFLSALPFQLTEAQKKVIQHILNDMRSEYAMNRLLLGDVGSGKTVVAATALFASVSAGFQAAFMVPTEILAEQHYFSLKQFFKGSNVQLALLTGSLSQRERKDLLAGLAMGTIDVVVGTHALIQKDVYFNNLGLIITDEQHRFGVEQRRQLRRKGTAPDVLLMTATPIPRTLAMTAFGDLDVSILDELPAGRKKIKTEWYKEEMLNRVFRFMYGQISKGRQAYVVCPLIEESDKLDVQNVLDMYSLLKNTFPHFRIGLLHGRLNTSEKEAVMEQFASGQLHILVATTVIEVGVNVPNATVMVIYDAERFGLAQLHQLRGRVGRGEHQSFCFLIANPKTEMGRERMRIMCSTTDGFQLAKSDLSLRGPGDFFGTKQSGLPQFKVADLILDEKALEVARNDAARLTASKVFWERDEYRPLRELIAQQLENQVNFLD